MERGCWTLHFEGSSSRVKGLGAGVVLKRPVGEKVLYKKQRFDSLSYASTKAIHCFDD